MDYFVGTKWPFTNGSKQHPQQYAHNMMMYPPQQDPRAMQYMQPPPPPMSHEQESTSVAASTVAKSTAPSTSIDISDYSSKVELPTVDAINTAFERLSDFTLKKVLPQDLKNPLEGLNPEMRANVDRINLSLEQNIRELMSNPSSKSDLEDIRAALVSLVARNDGYLLTPEQQKVDRERSTQRAMTKITKPILRFYPQLLQTIRALLAYDTAFHHNEVHFAEPNHTSAIIYREWMRVLGYLQSIHSVIVFANKQQLLSLEGYPVSLADFCRHSQAEIEALQAQILHCKETLNHLNETKTEYEKQLSALTSKFPGLSAEIARENSRLKIMEAKFVQHTDPACIALENVVSIKQAYNLLGG